MSIDIAAANWAEVRSALRDLVFDMDIASDGSLTREVLRVHRDCTVEVHCQTAALAATDRTPTEAEHG